MIRRIFLATIVFLGLAATAAFAQTGPATTGPQTAAPSQTFPYLNDQMLQGILSKMDSNMKFQNGKDKTTYRITLNHNGLTVPMNVDVNKSYLWLEINLGQPRDGANLPTNLGALLLQTHVKIGPTFMAIQHPNGVPTLNLLHRVDRSITPERLAAAFHEFLGDLTTSESFWKTIVRN